MRKRSCAVSYYTLFQLECAGIKLIIMSLALIISSFVFEII